MLFDHAAIACGDVEAMRAFYVEVLGFEVVARKAPSRPDSPGATYLVAPPGSTAAIELTPEAPVERAQPAGRRAQDAALRGPFDRGLSHLAFRVDDFERWEALLDARGVRWTGGPVEAMGGGKLRSFLDPEGNLLQIVERS